MPPHKLNLKIGAFMLLLRNFNINNGLCNGTRMGIKNIMENIVDCEVISGGRIGERVFIPRINLTSTENILPFKLKRRQLPLRLAYSTTINKSQGQTFEKAGLYLRHPVFTHGQLCVAFPRVSCLNNIRIKIKNNDYH
jgi:ATP-dependent DNA helicase PIF1